MNETKKFPNAISLPGGEIEDERLLPFFSPVERAGFFGLSNGKTYQYGALVYLGAAITAEDVLAKYEEHHSLPLNRSECISKLDKYIADLQSFKIGNVISIQYSEGGKISLSKVMDTPPAEKINLP
jgi:hypothetical protein